MTTTMLSIRVLLFAQLAEETGQDKLSLSLPQGCTVNDAINALIDIHPLFNEKKSHLAFAVNETYANPQLELHDGDTVAIIPPVSGG
ncbi:MAG: molybdopterin converting factor subunit 1 [Phycisphaerales bacterium]|nr:molybdopterin converting factor subunit 1 [Phycisphaerales bacterium]